MLNTLCCFGALADALITIAIIIAVTVGIVYAIKEPNARPYVIFAFCLAWVVGGVYSAFVCVDYYTKQHGQVLGEIEIHDPYEDFNFYEYNLTGLTFYPENGSYGYTTTYGTSIEFNGSEGEYTLLLNNSPCQTSSEFGRLNGHTALTFYDDTNWENCRINLDITFVFRSSEIELTVETDADSSEIGYLQEYMACNGFNLRIINQVYGGAT